MIRDGHMEKICVYGAIFTSEHASNIHGMILGGREVSEISGAQRHYHFYLLDSMASLLHLPFINSTARPSHEQLLQPSSHFGP